MRMVAEQESFEEALSKKVEAELVELRRTQEEKVDQIRVAFGNLRQQVTRLEAHAGPKARLTPEQMGQLRQMSPHCSLMEGEWSNLSWTRDITA
jgi:hypothetical protein